MKIKEIEMIAKKKEMIKKFIKIEIKKKNRMEKIIRIRKIGKKVRKVKYLIISQYFI